MVAASSNHSGGVNMGFLDGSVKFVKDSINLGTYAALGTKAGGEMTWKAWYGIGLAMMVLAPAARAGYVLPTWVETVEVQATLDLGTGQLVTEEFYTLGKLVQLGFGTRNFDGNTTLCMASAVSGYKRSFGSDGPPGAYEDLEKAEGLPDSAKKLKQIFIDHDGFLWSCPEYNSSITAVLKNTIDWVSRPVAGETPLRGFKGKTAALMSASPGAQGGLRGLVTVRSILSNIGVLVLPTQVAVARAKEAFTPEGALKDPSQQASIEGLGKELVAVLKKLTA